MSLRDIQNWVEDRSEVFLRSENKDKTRQKTVIVIYQEIPLLSTNTESGRTEQVPSAVFLGWDYYCVNGLPYGCSDPSRLLRDVFQGDEEKVVHFQPLWRRPCEDYRRDVRELCFVWKQCWWRRAASVIQVRRFHSLSKQLRRCLSLMVTDGSLTEHQVVSCQKEAISFYVFPDILLFLWIYNLISYLILFFLSEATTTRPREYTGWGSVWPELLSCMSSRSAFKTSAVFANWRRLPPNAFPKRRRQKLKRRRRSLLQFAFFRVWDPASFVFR